MAQSPHVAIIPSPGLGHLIPLVEFAKKLVLNHRFSVTFIVPTTSDSSRETQVDIFNSVPQGINHVVLEPVSFDDLSKATRAEIQVYRTMDRSLSLIRDALKSLVDKTKLVALVVDHFGTDAFDIAWEFKVPPYLFFLPNATTLCLTFYVPKLVELAIASVEFGDLAEPVQIPGSTLVFHNSDLPDPVNNRESDEYEFFLHQITRYNLAEGVMVNSCLELEEHAIKALQANEPGNRPPVYPIGPIIRSRSTDDHANCLVDGSLKWLDDQPDCSVLFVSFGSGGTLSLNQLHELALGLELSGQKFLWVARSPNDKSTNALHFNVESGTETLGFLPEGFPERTSRQGKVVPSWAPQVEILSHDSTGGFLTHCGWNSILESVVHGVPLIAWPLYAEQKMNAVFLSEGLKVALRPNAKKENGIIGREEIARVVKCLMQGEEGVMIRGRTNKLKIAAMEALGEHGSSTKSLCELVSIWKNYSNE